MLARRRPITVPPILPFALSLSLFAPSRPAAGGEPDRGPVPAEVAHQIIAEALANPRAFEALRTLTEEVGPRLAGSPGYRKAAEWAVEEFKRRGARATLEELTMETWERGKLSVDLVKPVARPLRAVATGFSPGTGGAKEGPVVDLGPTTPVLIDRARDRLKGAVVLMGPAPEGSSPASRAGLGAMKGLREAGAIAILLQWGRSTVKTSHRMPFRELPTVVISREDGELVRRAAAVPGGARVRIDMTSKINKDTRQWNVVGEVTGREKPEELVVIGAHLDSWDLGRGAIDNGHGSAAVLEAARLIAGVRPPRRTVRFVLFAGEEPGLIGSEAYVKRHAEEAPRTVFMFNEDSGPGDVTGVSLNMRPEGRAGMEEIARAASGLGVLGVDESDDGGSDSQAFLHAGIPCGELNRTGFDYMSAHHTPEDTLDKVNPAHLARLAAALAVLAYGAAERPERIAPHLTGAELDRRFPPPAAPPSSPSSPPPPRAR